VNKRRDRPSARVIVLDGEGRLLLFQVDDPLDAKPPVWITPGGGVEAGETLGEAASRELREETGLIVSPADLSGPVAVCSGNWEFRGTPYFSEDWFFAWRTITFEPDDTNWTDLERDVHRAWRWWTPEDLDTTDDAFLPVGLPDLARGLRRGEAPSEPVVLPWRTL
jgi:8-oxo-dGTP pyrophosphatase MutT (NUDIX family)